MSSGYTITQCRKCIGLTQEKLAEQINVSRQTIAMWETSKQFPSDNVAIIAARFLDTPEEELLEQLRWDRLHQRVDQLGEQYNANITVRPAKEGQQMEDLLENATQTIDGVTITVTKICKSIYSADPIHMKNLREGMDGKLPGRGMMVHGPMHGKLPRYAIMVRGPHDMPIFHIGEMLILHLLVENPKQNLRSSNRYIEDNLGNQFRSCLSGGAMDKEVGEYASRSVVVFDYAPEATSFTLRCDFINTHEDECDVLLFEDVPIDGRGITRTFGDDIITYNGVHRNEEKYGDDLYMIHFTYNKALEVRHVGVDSITDNLGNQYLMSGTASGVKEGVFYRHRSLETPIDPNATSISFKYLFARKILTFELRDLPLPS